MGKVFDKRLSKHLEHPHTVTDISGIQAYVNLLVQNLLIAGSSVNITLVNDKLVISATGSGFGGVSDHGDLTGLSDDDHTQYHNDARGDARYAQITHTHTASAIVSGTLDVAQGGTGAGDITAARSNLGLVIGTDVQAYAVVLQNTTAPFTTTLATKISGIETGADVTDAANVQAAIEAFSLATASLDETDVVLVLQSGTLKITTVQDILDLAGGSGLSQAQVLARALGA